MLRSKNWVITVCKSNSVELYDVAQTFKTELMDQYTTLAQLRCQFSVFFLCHHHQNATVVACV